MQNPWCPYQQIYLDLTFLSSSNLGSQATHPSLSAEGHSGLLTEVSTGGFVARSPLSHPAVTGDQRKCKPDHITALPRNLPFFLISCPIKPAIILRAKQSLHSRFPSPDICRLSHLFPSLFHSTHSLPAAPSTLDTAWLRTFASRAQSAWRTSLPAVTSQPLPILLAFHECQPSARPSLTTLLYITL